MQWIRAGISQNERPFMMMMMMMTMISRVLVSRSSAGEKRIRIVVDGSVAWDLWRFDGGRR